MEAPRPTPSPSPEPQASEGPEPLAMHGCPKSFDASWQERLLVLGSFFGGLICAVVFGMIYAPEHTKLLFAYVSVSFFGLGKFLPLVALTETTFGFYELGLVIWIMDTCTVLLLVYSIEALYSNKSAAHLLGKVQHNAGILLEAFPRIRSFAILGMVLFVLFPVSGTGAIGGAFLGALLGLHRYKIIAAISVGGMIGGMGMAYLAENFGKAIEPYRNNPWIIGLLALGFLLALYGLNRAYKKALARSKQQKAEVEDQA
ncbi:MAG: hypothetical protein CSA62_07060 [Planctomycetota bacterium]|nr:MAG: hypothetical protein CSA62_07060 [Planctomycetota bacterium]